jgi:hypothetical protein
MRNMSVLWTVILSAAVYVAACQSIPKERQEVVQPPVVAPDSPAQATKTNTQAAEQAKTPPAGYVVVNSLVVSVPGIGEVPGWVVTQGDRLQGVLVTMKGQTVPLHSLRNIKDRLVGPDWGTKVETKDLDGDGKAEIVVSGRTGNLAGVWVYRYMGETNEFEFLGDLPGTDILQRSDSDGSVVFEVVEISRTSKTSPSKRWKWKPGGFYLQA